MLWLRVDVEFFGVKQIQINKFGINTGTDGTFTTLFEMKTGNVPSVPRFFTAPAADLGGAMESTCRILP